MTYDRYLLKSFLHTFAVCFIAMFGLIAIIDLFENLDEMLALNGNNGPVRLIGLIATLNGFRSIEFLDRAGPALTVISAMTVLILLQRSGELHPLLAAGIPMYRIMRPIIIGSVVINGILVLNQELLVPRVTFLAHEIRNRNDPSKSSVEPMTDHTTRISIDGQRVNVAEKTIENPTFVLPVPTLVNDIITVEAATAKFRPETNGLPSGWLLKDITTPPVPELVKALTDEGAELVRIHKNGKDVFIASAVTCDQLFKRNSSFAALTTAELMSRIHCKAFGYVTIHRLVLYLHSRFTQPLMNIIAVLVTIPLMVRRESRGLVGDATICGFILAVLFVVTLGCQSLGAANLIAPDMAAWIPVVFGGAISAWLSGVIRT